MAKKKSSTYTQFGCLEKTKTKTETKNKNKTKQII